MQLSPAADFVVTGERIVTALCCLPRQSDCDSLQFQDIRSGSLHKDRTLSEPALVAAAEEMHHDLA